MSVFSRNLATATYLAHLRLDGSDLRLLLTGVGMRSTECSLQFKLDSRSQFVALGSLGVSGFRPRLFDAARQDGVDDRTEHVEAAADEEHVHPLFATALHRRPTTDRTRT